MVHEPNPGFLHPALFPASARFHEYVPEPGAHELANYATLDPREQVLVENSVVSRKAEFGDARFCAHEALKKLGRDSNEPILKGDRGMPVWPTPVVGSLTHTDGLRAAVVAPRLLVRSLGLDVEVEEPLPRGVLSSISVESERPQLERLRAAGVSCPDKVLFSAKEAIYKSWFPVTHRWLGFEQAEVEIRDDGSFVAFLRIRPTPVSFIAGKWCVRNGYVIATTAIV